MTTFDAEHTRIIGNVYKWLLQAMGLVFTNQQAIGCDLALTKTDPYDVLINPVVNKKCVISQFIIVVAK